ncbi:hypothetical protein ACVWXQ_009311 [Bradyrhizobium sp. S3.14.4]
MATLKVVLSATRMLPAELSLTGAEPPSEWTKG